MLHICNIVNNPNVIRILIRIVIMEEIYSLSSCFTKFFLCSSMLTSFFSINFVSSSTTLFTMTSLGSSANLLGGKTLGDALIGEAKAYFAQEAEG